MALQVWLPLNGNIKNQGLSNITVTNNGATVNDNGKIGKCYSFATNLYILLTNVPASSLSNCSVCFWIKIAANEGLWLLLSGQGVLYYLLAYRNASYQNGNFYSSANVGTSYKIYIDGVKGTAPINDGNWHHYCASGINLSSWTLFYINRYLTTTDGYNFTGLVNDFRIYDHALSAKEVKDISKGLILHYPLEGNPLGNLEFYDYIKGDGSSYIETNFIPSKNTTVKFKFKEDVNSSSTYYPLCHSTGSGLEFFTRKNTDYAIYNGTAELLTTGPSTVNLIEVKLRHNYCKANDTVLVDVAINNSLNPTLSLPIFGFKKTGNVMDSRKGSHYLYYFQIYDNNILKRDFKPCTYNGTPGVWDTVEGKFYSNQGTGTFTLGNKINVNNFASDCSGYRNDGTITGTLTLSNDTPRYNCSAVFDGSTNNIITSFPSYSNTATFCIWAKFSKFEVHLLDCRNALEIGYLPMYIKSTRVLVGGTSTSFLYINYSFSLNTWYHLVVVYKSDKTELYVNGNYIGNNTSAKGYNYSQILPLYIGSRCSGINKFLGLVSDFRVYVNALSAEDILELYNTSAYIYNSDNIASYKFIEGGEVLNITSLGTVISASYEEDETPVTFGDNYINSKEFIEI